MAELILTFESLSRRIARGEAGAEAIEHLIREAERPRKQKERMFWRSDVDPNIDEGGEKRRDHTADHVGAVLAEMQRLVEGRSHDLPRGKIGSEEGHLGQVQAPTATLESAPHVATHPGNVASRFDEIGIAQAQSRANVEPEGTVQDPIVQTD